jgi:hypothetical protein
MTTVQGEAMPDRSRIGAPLVFQNNAALFAWIFMAVWMLALAGLTGPALGAGEGQFWVQVVLGGLWLAGLWMSWLVLRASRTRIEVERHSVLVQDKFLWSTRERRFAPSVLAVSDIEEGTGEGTIYTCSLILPDKQRIIFAQGSSEAEVAKERDKLLDALRAG